MRYAMRMRELRKQQSIRIVLVVTAYMLGGIAMMVNIPMWAYVIPPVFLTVVMAALPAE